jgi:hypothetical protein
LAILHEVIIGSRGHHSPLINQKQLICNRHDGIAVSEDDDAFGSSKSDQSSEEMEEKRKAWEEPT